MRKELAAHGPKAAMKLGQSCKLLVKVGQNCGTTASAAGAEARKTAEKLRVARNNGKKWRKNCKLLVVMAKTASCSAKVANKPHKSSEESANGQGPTRRDRCK